jgi:Lysyl oxidase
MDAGISGRLRLAAVVAAAASVLATALVVAADSARSGSPGDALEPDLVVQRPYELYVDKGAKEIRLRVSNTVANIGDGPLEISGDGSLCDDKTGRFTMQSIFNDTDDPESIGYFERETEGGVPDQQLPAGCSRYHPEHDHWHFDNFARYRLLSEKTGELVGGSRKISFCVIDTGQPHPELPGTPDEPYYPQDPENPQFPSCSATSTDGLSIGWEDTYGASLPGQGIRVTKLRKGSYCLVLETDPAGPGRPNGVLSEIDETNNARDIKVWLRPHKQIVRRQSHDCKAN